MGHSRTARQIVIPQQILFVVKKSKLLRPQTHNLQLLKVIKLHIKKIKYSVTGYFVGSFYYDIVITRLL